MKCSINDIKNKQMLNFPIVTPQLLIQKVPKLILVRLPF